MPDFAFSLKQLFKNGYPEETLTSAVLLQRFLTGLRPEIGRQVLLHQKPANFNAAVKDAMAIEYALEFGEEDDTVHTVGQKQKTSEDVSNTAALLDALTKRLESLEMTIQKTQVKSRPAEGLGYGRNQGQRSRRVGPCYKCAEEGHLRRNCPLNYYRPAPTVDNSWPHNR